MTHAGMRGERARGLAVVGMGAFALLAASIAATSPAAGAPTDERDGRCAPHRHDAAGGARVMHGDSPRADPNTVSPGRAAAMNHQLREAVRAVPPGARGDGGRGTTIPVYFHVIEGVKNHGALGKKRIKRQLHVMNKAFGGRTARQAHDTPFRFRLEGIDRTKNPDWFTHRYGSQDERDMKKSLRVGGSRALNIYTAHPTEPGIELLGYATFPQDHRRKPWRDGVVILTESTPGGTIKGAGTDYSRGDTATHEVGHWMGLYHTFQGGCGQRNDHVTDTPAESGPGYGCPVGSDTCRAPGSDPIHNFMNYGIDTCIDRFTKGQTERMRLHWLAYRR
ncbi:MAG: metalloprotease MEP1-like protein [Nocardioidaceae bacterium]|nr:metalloprotease MEP1-like protein [Nocardioidaceae bacterium]